MLLVRPAGCGKETAPPVGAPQTSPAKYAGDGAPSGDKVSTAAASPAAQPSSSAAAPAAPDVSALHVLEIGPGRAQFARNHLRGHRVTFMEPYEPAAEAIEKTGMAPAWRVLRQDVRNGIPGGPYGIIYASHLIEHLGGDELYSALQDMDDALQPGGFLVLAAPILWGHFYCDITHVSPWMPHLVYRALTGGFGDMSRPPISDKYEQVTLLFGWEEDTLRDGTRQLMTVWDVPEYRARWWVLDYVMDLGRRVLRRCGVRQVRRNSWLLVMRKGK